MTDTPTNQSIDVLENKLLLFRDIVEGGRMTDVAVRQWAEDICFELIVEKSRYLGFVDGGVRL